MWALQLDCLRHSARTNKVRVMMEGAVMARSLQTFSSAETFETVGPAWPWFGRLQGAPTLLTDDSRGFRHVNHVIIWATMIGGIL